MSINNKLIPVPFADNAGETYKYQIPQTNDTTFPNKATYENGFPAVTMTDIAAGGIPPFGQDFNGVLNDITTAVRYIQAGNFQSYDSDFATSIGGYAINSIILGSDGKFYQAIKDSVTTNPVGDKTNWKLWLDFLPITGGTLSGDLTIKKNLPLLKMVNSAGDNEFKITAANGDYTQIATTTSDGSLKTTLRWNKSTNTWSFENSDITNKGKYVLKAGDYGIGGPSVWVGNSNIDDMSLENGIRYLQVTSGTRPIADNTYYHVLNTMESANSTVKQYASPNTANRLFMRTSVNGKIGEWDEFITTANIADYQSGLGIGQTWQDVTSLRDIGIIYTNETDKPIELSISPTYENGTFSVLSLHIDDVFVGQFGRNSIYNSPMSISAIVPPSSSYMVNVDRGVKIGFSWAELR